MMKELIISVAFLFVISGIIAGFVIVEKTSERIEQQAELIIQEANEIN